MVKRLSTMQETWVRSLGREDPLEKKMAIHSSTIAWKIPQTEDVNCALTFQSNQFNLKHSMAYLDFPGGSDGKASVYIARDLGSIPGSGRSAGEGNGNPLQYYCLENPMNRGAW